MSDTTAVPVEQAAPVEQANVEPTGAEPGKETEHGKTFTQAELDAIVTERLQRAQRKAAEAEAKARTDAERKAAEEQGEFKKLAESLRAELEQERAARKAAEIAGMRRDVAARQQLPAGLADRLRGETQEEIEADAELLLRALPKPAAPNINAGPATGGSKPNEFAGIDIDNLAARLGVSAKYAKEFLANGGGK